MRKISPLVLTVLLVFAVALSACAQAVPPTGEELTPPPASPPAVITDAPAPQETVPQEAPTQEPVTEEPQVPEETPVSEETPVQEPGAQEYRFAAIFPGTITDADYNSLGFLGVEAVQEELGIETAFSESVAVPDFERVLREYVDSGFNIIWAHGGEYYGPTTEIASQFPDVVFIVEGDSPLEDAPPNLWVIGRNFHTGFYALGALAAMSTQTGRIGYIGGLTLPFSYAEVHAVEQAIEDLGLDATVEPVWVGDFSDPTAARQLADAMIAEDVDVIMGSLNLGMLGIFEAVRANPGDRVLVTAKYTDKYGFAPDNYLTALLYDFSVPLIDIIQRIQAGEPGSFYELGFNNGVTLQMPLHNSSPEVQSEIQQILEDIESGAIEVVQDTTPIE